MITLPFSWWLPTSVTTSALLDITVTLLLLPASPAYTPATLATTLPTAPTATSL
jgi:hypothetical protein